MGRQLIKKFVQFFLFTCKLGFFVSRGDQYSDNSDIRRCPSCGWYGVILIRTGNRRSGSKNRRLQIIHQTFQAVFQGDGKIFHLPHLHNQAKGPQYAADHHHSIQIVP